jgi:hypothetical protein
MCHMTMLCYLFGRVWTSEGIWDHLPQFGIVGSGGALWAPEGVWDCFLWFPPLASFVLELLVQEVPCGLQRVYRTAFCGSSPWPPSFWNCQFGRCLVGSKGCMVSLSAVPPLDLLHFGIVGSGRSLMGFRGCMGLLFAVPPFIIQSSLCEQGRPCGPTGAM